MMPSTLQMATTAGSLSSVNMVYCFTLSEMLQEAKVETSVTLKTLPVSVMKSFLDEWKVKYVPSEHITKLKFISAVETMFVLHGSHEMVKKDVIESTDVGSIVDLKFPDWILLLRESHISEPEIREIIKQAGGKPEIICQLSDSTLKKLNIGSPAKQVLTNFVNQWRIELFGDVSGNKDKDEDKKESDDEDDADDVIKPKKTKVKTDPSLRKALLSEKDEDEKDETLVSNAKVNRVNVSNESHDSQPENISFRGQPSNVSGQANVKPSSGSAIRFNGNDDDDDVIDRVKVQLPVLPEYVGLQRKGDPWKWLESVKRILEITRCHKLDKLDVLKKAMSYEFIPFARIEDKQVHTWQSYITALEMHLRSPSNISQAMAEFQDWRWNWDCHPDEFVTKLEQLITKVKGEPTPDDLIFHIISRIPKEMYDVLVRLGKSKNLSDLIACMVTEYNIHLRDKKSSDKNQKKDEKKVELKPGISSSKQVNSAESTNSNSNNKRRSGVKCFKCNLIGHIAKDCRVKPKGDANNNDKNVPAQLRLAKVNPTYGQGDSSSSSAVESSNVIVEKKVYPIPSSIKLPNNPESECQFMMKELEDNEPESVGLISQLDPNLQFPLLKMTLCYPNRKVTKVGYVLVDTGASSPCIDYDLAQQLKCFMMMSNVAVKGVIADAVQTVEGAAYAIMKHPEMEQSKVIKFQVMRNLEPKFVLGNKFSDAFYCGLINLGNKWQVGIKEKKDGNWLSPEILFRFCTPEESLSMINKPEVQHVATIKEREEFFGKIDSSILPLSSKENISSQQLIHYNDEIEQLESLNYLLELSENNLVMDNIVPVYLTKEVKSELSLSERLMKRMNPSLNVKQKDELLNVLLDFSQVFSQNKHDLGLVPWTRWPIKIDIGDNVVPYQRPYPCTTERRLEYQKITDDLIANDIIEESDADGGSPALLVGKPDGSFRLSNDLRAVNRLTKVVYHPMPRIDDCLEAIRGTKYFNMFDLYQGYFQIEIPPSERWKTVFVTPDRKFHYKRLPMGLACAPFEFQRMMNTVLKGLNYTECLGYFDDIPVMGKSWDELLKNTRFVLERLLDWNLKIKTDKCVFGVTELVLLGHLVNGEGIRPDPDKVSALKRLPPPTSVRQLQSQLGCYNFFSRYIQNFSKITAPLYRLTSKVRKFKMLKQDYEALETLKSSLIKETMLVYFNPDLRKKLTVDASDVAVGGILMQEDENQPIPDGYQSLKDVQIEKVKHWRPMYFFSQKLATHQQSYSVSEKECLAVLVAIKKFKHYLEGDEFLVETDHHALCQLPKLKFKNQRLERWTIILSGFKFKVIYAKGEKHGPDCFSRYQSEWDHRKTIDPEAEIIENLFYFHHNELSEIESVDESAVHHFKCFDSSVKDNFSARYHYHYQIDENDNWKLNIVDEQLNDQYICEIVQKLVSDPQSELHKNFLFVNKLLFRKPTIGYDNSRIVINDSILKKVFEEEHYSALGGHFGVEKTYLQIARRFWMKNLFERIKQLTNNCQVCYLGKSTNVTYAEPSLKPIPNLILDRLEMDAQGPITFKNGQKKIILVLVDSLSRFVYAKLLPNQKATTVIKFLKEYFSILSFPAVIQTDRGRNFLSDEVKRYLRSIGVTHEISNAYHPQSQGIVERANRTIAERLRTSIQDKEKIDLDVSLMDAVIAINGSVHKVHRFTPFYLITGRHMKKPIDLKLGISVSHENNQVELSRMVARERLLKRQLYYQDRLRLITKRNPFQPGDLCYSKNCAPSIGTTKKLVNKFFGPFVVISVKKGSVLLLDPETYERFTNNLELLKPHKGDIPEELKLIRDNVLSDQQVDPSSDVNDDPDETISNDQLLIDALNEFDEFEDFRPNIELSSEKDLGDVNNENDISDEIDENSFNNEFNKLLNNFDQINQSYDSDAETVIDEVCNLKSLEKFAKRKKRKKYITANRDIIQNSQIINNDNCNGPVTRRKLISVNSLSLKILNENVEKIEFKNKFKQANLVRVANEDAVKSAKEWLENKFPCYWFKSEFNGDEEVNQDVLRRRERKRFKIARAFASRPKLEMPLMLKSQIDEIDEQARVCPDRHLIFSINMSTVNIDEDGKLMPRPCWIIIIDGNFETVYETLVRHKQVERVNYHIHGLDPRDLRYARNLNTARLQVIQFLACAKTIVGHGLINQLNWLGLTQTEISYLYPKMRDIGNFYSPYIEHPLNIHAVCYLWFCGYILPLKAHSPGVEAITQLRLYFLSWKDIELIAERNGGIHNRNVSFTCGNKVTSALLLDFEEGVKRGVVSWPRNWRFNKETTIPNFDGNCVAPEERVHKKTTDFLAHHRNLNNNQVREMLKPEIRAQRIKKLVKAQKRGENDSDSDDTEIIPSSSKPSSQIGLEIQLVDEELDWEPEA